MRFLSTILLAVLGLLSCQVPVSSPRASNSGLTLTLAYTDVGSTRSIGGTPRLLLPNAGYAVVTLTDSKNAVQTNAQSLTSQAPVTFNFPSVAPGTYTISAKAYVDASATVPLFAQQTTVDLKGGTNQIKLYLLPATVTSVVSGSPQKGTIAASSTVSFKYTLTNKADYVQISGIPAGAGYFLQDSTGSPVVDTAGVVSPGATDGTLYLTLYNASGSSVVSYSGLGLSETKGAPVAPPAVFTVLANGVYASGPALASLSSVSFKYTMVNALDPVVITGIPVGATYVLQNSTGAIAADVSGAVAGGASDGVLYLTLYNPTGSSLGYSLMKLTEAITIHVTGVSVLPSSHSLLVGATYSLSSSIVPVGATNQSVSWTSSNTAVATVNTFGVVTGVAAGASTITVTTVDGGFAATSAVTVTAPVLIGQGTPLSLTPTQTTIAGSGTAGYGDGTGIAAVFSGPSGITTDGTNLYVVDTGNNNIRKIVISSGVVTTLAGSVVGSTGSADGTGTGATFYHPTGITTDGTNLYVVDRFNYKIRKIVIATGVVSTVASGFSNPLAITNDGTNLYVVDNGNHTICKIVIATSVVTTLAGTTGVPGSVDATGTAASFQSPFNIATDGTNLFVSDNGNYKIRKIVIATGVVTTLAGSGTSGHLDGTGAGASFTQTDGITTDGTNLYLADPAVIRKIVIATGVVTTLATASCLSCSGLTTDGISLYKVDYALNVIDKIQ